MGEPRPITLREVLDYGNLWDFSKVDIRETWEVVRLIDGLWMKLYAERQKTAKPAQP
jgi:hypothetical protein